VDVKAEAFGPELEAHESRPVPPAGRRRRLLGIATLVGLAAVLVLGLLWAPEDAIQGPPQRIFYIHVPSAWVGFLAFFVVFVASIGVLATGKRSFDDLASASAEVGIVFTTAVLITGPLWGRPIWHVYWTWDPRLTSYLMLWLIYLSYLVLRGYVPEAARRARYSAVVGIVGFLDVPIVYLSVRWWRSEHPLQLVFEQNGLPGQMLVALLVGVVAFTLLYVYLMSVRLRVGRLAQRAEEEVESE
jgi:heme exporter protein C